MSETLSGREVTFQDHYTTNSIQINLNRIEKNQFCDVFPILIFY